MHTTQDAPQPARNVREGWEEAFKLMAKRGDDTPLDGDAWLATEFDAHEWEWSGLKAVEQCPGWALFHCLA